MNLFKNFFLVSLLIISTIGIFGCVSSDNYDTSTVNPVPTEFINPCEWNWEWGTTKYIGRSEAPQGYVYAVVTIYLKNDAELPVSTYSGHWKFTGNGIEYRHDSITYSDSINHQTVEVQKGGEFATEIVYLVRDDVVTASIEYTGYNAPPLKRDRLLFIEM